MFSGVALTIQVVYQFKCIRDSCGRQLPISAESTQLHSRRQQYNKTSLLAVSDLLPSAVYAHAGPWTFRQRPKPTGPGSSGVVLPLAEITIPFAISDLSHGRSNAPGSGRAYSHPRQRISLSDMYSIWFARRSHGWKLSIHRLRSVAGFARDPPTSPVPLCT